MYMVEKIKPYRVQVAEETLQDLRERLDHTRWPDEVENAGWDYGIPLGYMREIVEYWRTQFDWRAQERSINSFANYRVDLDGIGVHFIHERGHGPKPLPLLITHGWPSSFYEMLKLIPLLTDPASHGGKPTDAFDVVIPSVPGHGFSDRPRQPGFNDYLVAKLWIKLMAELGYERFAAHAHDLGASITGLLCLHHPEYVIGYHTTNPANPGPAVQPDATDLTEAERAYLTYKKQRARKESGYAQIQGTRPQTLAYGLNDSPAGLAAWILEKWHGWTTQPGENSPFPFTHDELLANVMIYWATQTINSANRYYHEDEYIPWPKPGDRVRVPVGVALTTQQIERPPREYVERLYPDIRHWVELPRGGHFVALEEPQLVAESIRAFFRQLR
jgi:pimeloyl-ACP methyl ester carboxylesterase